MNVPTMSWQASASETAASEAPPVNRMVIAVLSLVGFFIAFYLLAHTLGWTGPLVCGVGECSTVQSSRYAWVGPVPVSGIGLVGYLVLLGLSVLGIQPAWRSSGGVGVLLLGASTVGLAYSAYLTYLEAAVIRAWCQWCVMSAILATLIFLASLPEVGRMRRRSP
ncbi:MAG: vitamin K epoxide reductase family protein [Gemmatimonadota bacterium]